MKKRIILFIVNALILGGVAWYIATNWSDFTSLSISNPLWLVPVVGMILINIHGVGELLAVSLRPLGVKLTFNETFGLSNLTRFGNFVSPGYLGAAIRAKYLKERHEYPYTSFMASFFASNMIFYLINGLFIIFAIVLLSVSLDSLVGISLIFIGLIAFFILSLTLPLQKVVGWLSKKKNNNRRKTYKHLHSLVHGWETIRKDRTTLGSIIFWSVVAVISSAGILLFMFYSFGLDITALKSLFIAVVSGWDSIISITPASIGIREGLMAFSAKLVSVSVATTLAVAILRRVLVFLVAALFSLFYSNKLLHESLLKTIKDTDKKDTA